MIFTETGFNNLFVIAASIMSDERGEFFRIFDKQIFQEHLFPFECIQSNRSVNFKKGTLRGMHYQKPPYAESKLVQCTRGRIFDVVTDLRKSSLTFQKSFSIELSADAKNMLAIPEGFAHGFQTLEDNSEVLYMHSREYKRDFEGAFRFDDPLFQLRWPLPVSFISDRDKNHPKLDPLVDGF